jgi:hypothetical protein
VYRLETGKSSVYSTDELANTSCCAVLIARQDSDSDYYSEACKAVAAGKFRDIPISASVGKEKSVSKGQFYQALADAMAARLAARVREELM